MLIIKTQTKSKKLGGQFDPLKNFFPSQLVMSTHFSAMRVLILVAHVDPTQSAHSYRIANAINESFVANGHETRLVDLIKVGFDKVATSGDFKEVKLDNFSYGCNQTPDNLIDDIKAQQANIEWATHIFAIGPIWFSRFPACFYAYTERVFTFGFGWDYKHNGVNGYFGDKRFAVIITAGAPPMAFMGDNGEGLDAYLQTVTYPFRYTGMKVTHAIGMYGPNSPNRIHEHKAWIEKLKDVVLKIDQWKVIPADQFKYKTLSEMNPETIDTIIQE